LIVGDRSKTGRTAQVAERGRSTALSTHTCLSRFFLPTDRCTLQAAVYRNRREDQNSVNAAVGGFLPACEQNCNRPAAFKSATVRERPVADVRCAPKQSSVALTTYFVDVTTDIELWRASLPKGPVILKDSG